MPVNPEGAGKISYRQTNPVLRRPRLPANPSIFLPALNPFTKKPGNSGTATASPRAPAAAAAVASGGRSLTRSGADGARPRGPTARAPVTTATPDRPPEGPAGESGRAPARWRRRGRGVRSERRTPSLRPARRASGPPARPRAPRGPMAATGAGARRVVGLPRAGRAPR